MLYFPVRRSLHPLQPDEGTLRKKAAADPEEGRAQVTNFILHSFKSDYAYLKPHRLQPDEGTRKKAGADPEEGLDGSSNLFSPRLL